MILDNMKLIEVEPAKVDGEFPNSAGTYLSELEEEEEHCKYPTHRKTLMHLARKMVVRDFFVVCVPSSFPSYPSHFLCAFLLLQPR